MEEVQPFKKLCWNNSIAIGGKKKKKKQKGKNSKPYTSGKNVLQNSHRFKCETVKLLEENIKKNFFSVPRTRYKILGLDTRSIIHKRRS